MRSCFRFIRALRARVSRLSILVLLLASNVVYAVPPDSNSSGGIGGGAVSYWLLAFLLAANIAGVIYMRRWAATIESGKDKE